MSRYKSRISILETGNKELKRDLDSCQMLQKNLRGQLQKVSENSASSEPFIFQAKSFYSTNLIVCFQKERQLADSLRTNRRLMSLSAKDDAQDVSTNEKVPKEKNLKLRDDEQRYTKIAETESKAPSGSPIR